MSRVTQQHTATHNHTAASWGHTLKTGIVPFKKCFIISAWDDVPLFCLLDRVSPLAVHQSCVCGLSSMSLCVVVLPHTYGGAAPKWAMSLFADFIRAIWRNGEGEWFH